MTLCEDLTTRLQDLQDSLYELAAMRAQVEQYHSLSELQETQTDVTKKMQNMIRRFEAEQKVLDGMKLNFTEELAKAVGEDTERLRRDSTLDSDGYLTYVNFAPTTNLEDLDLSYLGRLRTVSLYQNTVTTTLETENLPESLVKLDLAESTVNIEDLDLSECTNLQVLHLLANERTTALHTKHLPVSLAKLMLSSSTMNIEDLDLSGFTKLTWLSLIGNDATTSLRAEYLPVSLENLNISDSVVNIEDLDLSGFTKLTWLNLTGNLATTDLKTMNLPANLKKLILINCTIPVDTIAAIQKARPNLKIKTKY